MRRPPAPEAVEPKEHLLNLVPAVPALVLLAVAAALHYTAQYGTADFGLAYQGGAEAWASGHPERVGTWMSTPFLALAMAAVSRVAPVQIAGWLFMAANLSLWMVMLVTVWTRLRAFFPVPLWWTTLAAVGAFAPAVSTIFWLQFNLVVFALAIGGFSLVGRKNRLAGLLIGLSVALKPIAVLLPFALLVRSRSRAAGLSSLAGLSVSTLLSLGFLAWRGGDPKLLDPIGYLARLSDSGLATLWGSGQPVAEGCWVENYSLLALLCRLGLQPSMLIGAAIGAVGLLIGWLLVRRLPPTVEGDWETFAAACFLSVLLGPIEWPHYGLLMAPLLLLLAYQFWRDRAPRPLWLGLAAAFLASEFVWDPLSSLAGASVRLEDFLYTVGQFGQYFLFLVWVRWRMLEPSVVRAHPNPAPPGSDLAGVTVETPAYQRPSS